MPSPSGDLKTRLPPLPLDFLIEKDILRDFIFRVNMLGEFTEKTVVIKANFIIIICENPANMRYGSNVV